MEPAHSTASEPAGPRPLEAEGGGRRWRTLARLVVIALIAASFLWQMAHGICPVP